MQTLPFYVHLVFGATVVLAAWLFFKAAHYSKPLMLLVTAWIGLQSVLGIAGFYSNPATMSSRFPLLYLPPLLFLFYRFATKKGRAFIAGLDLPTLTLLHSIRVPVEIVLFWLFSYQLVPQAMTFHGRNFDIVAGLTAPLVYYFGFIRKTISRKLILLWNVLCLALLVNIVSNALLSLPARFQQFGFEQPNTGLGYFPFMLLPAFLVPVVLFSMLAAIRQLLQGHTKEKAQPNISNYIH